MLPSQKPNKRKRCTTSLKSSLVVHDVQNQDLVRHQTISCNPNGVPITEHSLHNVGPPLKKPQIEPASVTITDSEHVQNDGSDFVPSTVTRQKHGASEHFREIKLHQATFIRGFAFRHTHRNIGQKCPNHPEVQANLRCTTCDQSPLLCNLCMVETHRFNCFHRIEMWNGKFFEHYTLKEAGLFLALEHNGQRCPHAPQDAVTITAVDTTGVQQLSVIYCHCVRHLPPIEQLLRGGLWPATVISPSTVFTFRLLEFYHQYLLVSRNSTLDFWQMLCRVTNNAFPERVPDRYNQLLRTGCIYRVIKALEESGQSFDIDQHLNTSRRPGLIAMPCVACPEPGFNMPEDWELTPPNKSFIHRLFLHQDANFRNQLKTKKKRDPDDTALFEGRCFYPPETEFQEYLKNVTHTEEKSDCANHKAVNLQHILKFKHMDVTGIMAVVCRHDCFRPGGQNDLQKGERYANADYALAGALSWIPVPKEIGHTYDIGCQYSKNLVLRFQANFPDLVPVVFSIKHAIPKKHIIGHVEECQIRWSCNYLLGFGRVYGEGIEAIWAEDNQQSTSLREMNAGHRHDVTDDNHLDWNIRKNQRCSTSTFEHFAAGVDEYTEALLAFQAASIMIDPEMILQWQKMDVMPHELAKGQWYSVYQIQQSKMPTQTQIYHHLLREEVSTSVNSYTEATEQTYDRSLVQLIQTGLQIQITQSDLRNKLSVSTSNDLTRDEQVLQTKRFQLSGEIRRWTSKMAAHIPLLLNFDMSISSEEPEDMLIGLPSDLIAIGTMQLNGSVLVAIELLLRQGQANDALSAIRDHLRHESCLRSQKKKHAIGNGPTTRANSSLQTAARKKNRSADIYIAARQAMIDLGGFDSDNTLSERYPELNKTTDMRMKDPTVILKLGESGEEESWIWRFGEENTTSDSSEWQIETDRLRWFKTRAAVERWREELLLRDEDFNRIHRTYIRLSSAFTALAHNVQVAGPRALALKTAQVFSERAIEAHSLHEKARGILSANRLNLDHPF